MNILKPFMALCLMQALPCTVRAAQPDSVYVFPYPTTNDHGRRGMQFVWSADGEHWQDVAEGMVFMRCDFGAWKYMYKPRLIQDRQDGRLHCFWNLDPEGSAIGYASSTDLIKWTPQEYFMATEQGKFAVKDGRMPVADTVQIGDKTIVGYALKVSYGILEGMERHGIYRSALNALRGERAEHDAARFAGLQTVNARITVDEGRAKPISENLIGVFFEDLNYAADGGLYAELVQNRDFEYSEADGNKDRNWNSRYAWSVEGEGMAFDVSTEQPVHPNNPHYAVLDVAQPGGGFTNTGFDGIAVKEGEKYDFSLFTRTPDGKGGGKAVVRLVDPQGKTVAETTVKLSSKTWKKREAVLKATATVAQARLVIIPQSAGRYALDMISLFPQKTFKGRKNGLRADLAQAIADIRPRFVRFPGGCLAHGDGVDNIYHWKETIGPLEARKPAANIWRYHQTRGLGYFEYFQFCEDIGAEPLPVVAAGVPCQNSGIGGPSHHSKDFVTANGQQGGIPMEEMGQYIQDVLDLIEYANGDAKTTRWGRERAKAGHPEPFNLKYIGLGNEDLISRVFTERFTMIYEAVRAKYPDIVVIGTTGPSCEGTDYEEGWALADRLKLPMVDEHNYNTPGWYINHQDYYDHYDRSKSKVYLGEYAAHAPGRVNNMETALSTALYLTSIERNGDVVSMASYAPLLAKEGRTQWTPDLIYFNNTDVRLTTDYYVQQLFGRNSGSEYLPSTVLLDRKEKNVRNRVGVSVVKDGESDDLIVKLVNLLPVAVKTDVEIPSLAGHQAVGQKTVLSGRPSDTNAVPVESAMEIGEKFPYEMPAYSFTVIRIKRECK